MKFNFFKTSEPNPVILNSSVGTHNEYSRTTWVEKTLGGFPEGLSILDAGAGESQYKKHCQHLKYTSQDFGQYEGDGNGKGLQTRKWDNSKIDILSDICSIPVSDESFDIVMCTEVLEHVIDPQKALLELNRILKKGGYLLITAPFCSLTHFAPFHYSAGFSKYFYEDFCQRNNYKLLELTPNGNYFEYIAQELRRLTHVAETYTKERLSKTDVDAVNILLNSLQNLSDKDTISNELLCFGYHFLAKKN